MNEQKPTRYIDSIVKYCQGCRWGGVTYDDEDAVRAFPNEDHHFTEYCRLGLQDTEPTQEELDEFEKLAYQGLKEIEDLATYGVDDLPF